MEIYGIHFLKRAICMTKSEFLQTMAQPFTIFNFVIHILSVVH